MIRYYCDVCNDEIKRQGRLSGHVLFGNKTEVGIEVCFQTGNIWHPKDEGELCPKCIAATIMVLAYGGGYSVKSRADVLAPLNETQIPLEGSYKVTGDSRNTE